MEKQSQRNMKRDFRGQLLLALSAPLDDEDNEQGTEPEADGRILAELEGGTCRTSHRTKALQMTSK